MSAKASTKLLAGAVASHQGAAVATQSAATVAEETLDPESVALAPIYELTSCRNTLSDGIRMSRALPYVAGDALRVVCSAIDKGGCKQRCDRVLCRVD